MKAIEIMVTAAVGFIIGWHCCRLKSIKQTHKPFGEELKEI